MQGNQDEGSRPLRGRHWDNTTPDKGQQKTETI